MRKSLNSLALIAVIATVHFASFASGTKSASAWQVVHPQSPDSAGTSYYPSIRFGHTFNAHKGKLIATHGYYYDRQRHNATWLSDTWALDAVNRRHTWERLSDHYPHADAHSFYSAKRDPPTPCGRFGHAAAVVGDALYLYGGHDGGYSRTNRSDYQPGHDFEEFWRFDLKSHAWSLLWPIAYGGRPGKRYLASAAAVQGRFIMYGGLGEVQGEVWSYNPDEDRWERLADEVPVEKGGPGRRAAHSLIGWSGGVSGKTGVVLYGGRSVLPNGTNVVHDDAWFFDLASRKWTRLQPVMLQHNASSSTPSSAAAAAAAPLLAPPARVYHAAMDVVLPYTPSSPAKHSSSSGSSGQASKRAPHKRRAVHVGVVAGGSLASPAIKCAKDAWAFSLDCAASRIFWTRLPDFPAALYDTRGAAWDGTAYLYGGHLCALEYPDQGLSYPYWYVNEVLSLDLRKEAAVGALLARVGEGGEGAGGVCEMELDEGQEAAEGGTGRGKEEL